jgi:pimeloyl-ACP methyl ester carboxylesterase
MTKPVEKDIVVEGHLIHYYRAEAKGEKKNVVLFLHGWGSNSGLWLNSCVSLTRQGFELIFMDLPGFGKSQTPKTPFHLDDYARIISEFANKLEVMNPVLVGHSFGGKTAVRIAAKKLIPISGLVLVDSSGLPHTSLTTQTKIKIAQTVKPIMDLPFMHGVRSRLLRIAGSDDYIATPLLRETFVNIVREHIEFDLPQVQAKTLIMWGGNDENAYSPVSDVAVFHKLIPHADAHIIQSAGHYCFLDAPLEFAETLLEFLTSLHGKN